MISIALTSSLVALAIASIFLFWVMKHKPKTKRPLRTVSLEPQRNKSTLAEESKEDSETDLGTDSLFPEEINKDENEGD